MTQTIDRDRIRRWASCVDDPHQVDEMAVPSYLHPNPLIRWLFRKRLATALALLGTGPFRAGLDFGCGVGLLLPELAARTDRVFATDLELGPARAMKAELGLENLTLVEPELLEATVEEGSLDYVIATDSLEHVDDPATRIATFATMLRPGGVFILSGPTETRLYRLGRLLAGFGGKEHYHHTDIFDLHDTIGADGRFARDEGRRLPVPGLVEAFLIDRFRRR